MKSLISLGAFLLASCAPLMQGAIQISYSIDSGAAVTCASSATSSAAIICSTIGGPPMVTGLEATSNSPGTPSIAEEMSATLSITNGSLVDHTIEIFVAAQGFTAPVTPPNIILDSHIGGTVAVGAPSNLLSFRSCVDPTNSLSACPAGSIMSGNGTPDVTTTGSFKDDQIATITSLAATYSVGEDLLLTIDPGSSINFSASTTLTPVPEPAAAVLLASTLLGVSLLFRRKLQFKRG